MSTSGPPPRQPYKGNKRNLVLAFDVGTTYSGASFSILDPGQVPKIQGVTKFPAQDTANAASKIPTILYYDQLGNVMAVGAEAMREGIENEALDGDWVKAEWFKLHLRSRYGPGGETITQQIPPLPPRRTVIQVFADFLRYLMECTVTYIQDTHPNGIELYEGLKANTSVVLSHPNGWEGSEQSEMRRAAVLAGLVPDTPAGHARLSFVTEGEASLHFAIENNVLSTALKKGDGVVVVDAGGGTVDISTYRQSPTGDGNVLEEIAAPQCYFKGSVFVALAAKAFLSSFLANSRYLDDIDHIVRCFDENTKLRFKSDTDVQYIKFGSARDNDASCNIRIGQLRMQGTDVAMFFEPSVTCVVEAIKQQVKASPHRITHVILVGGFAASAWLFNSVRSRLSREGLNVFRPEHHANKAVSDGAVSFYLDHFVRTRVAKFTYGVHTEVVYNPDVPDHASRQAKAVRDNDGRLFLPAAFSIILPKDTQVNEQQEFRRSYFNDVSSLSELKGYGTYIYCYRGKDKLPKWMDEERHNYTENCTITADLTTVPYTTAVNDDGATYYRFHYDIIMLFGQTELKAQLAWKENGQQKTGPASIIYDPRD